MSQRRFFLTFIVTSLTVWTNIAVVGCSGTATPAKKVSCFEPPHAKLEGPTNGFFTLQHDFSFFDSKGKQWKAPKATLSDGASIPPIFLSLTQGQWSPRYADAAVVHDAYCQRENKEGALFHQEKWQDVHRMFYEACRVAGSRALRAKVMYAAVYLGGPRWGDPRRSLESLPSEVLVGAFEKCKQWIEAKDPTIEEIDQWMTELEASLIRGDGSKPSWKE
jgi:hypothetical protein